MAEDEKGFALDESAQALYKQLEGIDETVRAADSVGLESELMAFFQQEEKRLNQCRVLMAQAACTFIDLISSGSDALSKANEQKVRVFFSALKQLGEFSEKGDTVYCRFRGQQYAPGAEGGSADLEEYDYELSMGNVLLDFQVAQTVEKNDKVKAKNLSGNLLKAFKVMGMMKIFNFSLDVATGSDGDDFDRHLDSIKYLVHYYKSQGNKAGPASFAVSDEYGRPNINLTLLALINNNS